MNGAPRPAGAGPTPHARAAAPRPHSARAESRSIAAGTAPPASGPPPKPPITALNDAIALGCTTAVGRLQAERAAKMSLTPGRPRQKTVQASSNPHLLPSPNLGTLASKALHTGRQTMHTEPQLLQKLLHFVRQGLQDTEPGTPDYVEERLEVFRRAFNHFIAAYGAYAPLLLGIKEAYEDALARAGVRATRVDEVTERLALMQAESQQLLAHLQQDAKADRDARLGEAAEADALLRESRRENERLHSEVRRMRNEVEHARKLKEVADLKNVELFKQVEHWQAETDAARRALADDQELERVRAELKQLANREKMYAPASRSTRAGVLAAIITLVPQMRRHLVASLSHTHSRASKPSHQPQHTHRLESPP